MFDIQIQSNYKCNWECLVCDSKHNMPHYKNEPSNIDFDKFIETVIYLRDRETLGYIDKKVEVSFGYGTEPTIDPQFVERYNKLITAGLDNITVVTNGSMIKKLYNDGFKFNEKTVVILSVLGGLKPPRSYRNITGKSFSYIIDLVRFLNENNIKPALGMSQDFNELMSLKLMLDMLGDLKFDLLIRRIKPESPGFVGVSVLEKFLKSTNRFYVLDFLNHNKGMWEDCPFRYRIPFLNDGKFTYCCFHPYVIADLTKTDPKRTAEMIGEACRSKLIKLNDCNVCKALFK